MLTLSGILRFNNVRSNFMGCFMVLLEIKLIIVESGLLSEFICPLNFYYYFIFIIEVR